MQTAHHIVFALAASCVGAGVARAEWGIGAAVGAQPALSVQYVESSHEAYHVLAHVGNDSALVQGDYQRFFFPRDFSGPTVRCGAYGGLGLTGEATRDQAEAERWYLHLPVGVQANVEPLHLSAFAEIAARIGALPGTGLAPAVSGGIRAYF